MIRRLAAGRSRTSKGIAGTLGVVAMLAGCASAPVDRIELMPAPDVYGDGLLNPLPETSRSTAYRTTASCSLPTARQRLPGTRKSTT